MILVFRWFWTNFRICHFLYNLMPKKCILWLISSPKIYMMYFAFMVQRSQHSIHLTTSTLALPLIEEVDKVIDCARRVIKSKPDWLLGLIKHLIEECWLLTALWKSTIYQLVVLLIWDIPFRHNVMIWSWDEDMTRLFRWKQVDET